MASKLLPIATSMKGRVTIFSIIGCPHCMKAKNILMEKGIEYYDINIESYPNLRDWLFKTAKSKTVPQIFFNSIHVGGHSDLQETIKTDEKWKRLIDEIKNNAPGIDAPQLPDPKTAISTDLNFDFTCEPDEYSRLVEEVRKSGIIKNHSKMLVSTVENAFTGKDFIEWATKTKQMDFNTAMEMGQSLISQHFGKPLGSDTETFKNDSTLYRLLDDDKTNALNFGDTPSCIGGSASEIGEMLRKLILKLYSVFLSSDGRTVNYQGIAKSSEYEKYVKLTKELIRTDVENCSREEKLAFFINIYNALVIHGNIVRGPPKNLWQRYKFFNTVRYIIGGHEYSLQDIENGVLRANRKGVGQFSLPFSKTDARRKVALEKTEPLIHFALNCGAQSCPPIKTFSANGIDNQLTLACEGFLENNDGCFLDKNEIKLSKIFKWYQEDFGRNKEEVAQWVCDHMATGDKKQQMESMLTKRARISFLNYNWDNNSK